VSTWPYWRQLKSAAWLVAALALAWRSGTLVADGTLGVRVVPAVAVIVILGPLLGRWILARLDHGALALEIPVVLLLASTLVFRERGAADLAYDPLDSAAQLRVVFVGLAALLGAAAVLRGADPSRPPWRMTLPFALYTAYMVVVFLGAPLSVNALLTAYRGVELLTVIVVIAGAYRVVGVAATRRFETVLYAYTAGLVTWIWMGLVLYPGRAIARPLDNSIRWKWELKGVYPTLAANGVGTLGAILAVWSLARLLAGGPRRRPAVDLLFTCLGVATVIAAQYRTGYIAIVVALCVLVVLRYRAALPVVGFTVVVVLLWNPSIIQQSEPYALRGQTTEEARELSGRVEYWRDAIPVWQRSPILGRGLLTASRFEVLEASGNDRTAGVHSTWVEALVGTGVVGASLLLVAVAVTMGRLARGARQHTVPLVILAVILVRSGTGNTFESVSYEALLVAVMFASSRARTRPAAEEGPAIHGASAALALR